MKLINYSIKQKTNFIFGIVFLGVFFGGGLVLWFTFQQRDYELIINIAGRNRMLSQRMGGMLQFINDSEPSVAQKARKQFEEALQWHIQSLEVIKNGGVAPGFQSYQTIAAAPANLYPYIQKIEFELAEYQRLWQTLSTNLSTKQANSEVYKTSYQNLQTIYFKGALLQKNIDLVNAYSEYTDENYRLLVSILVIAVVVCLVIIVVAFFFFWQMLVRPLNHISQSADMLARGYLHVKTNYVSANELGKIGKALNHLTNNLSKANQFIKRIGEGDFEVKLNLQGFDENKEGLAEALIEMRNRLKILAQEEDKRNWANQGLAMFSDILRDNSTDLHRLCQLIITHLVKYLQAQQGGIFLLNNQDNETNYLELTAAYAYDASRINQNRIAPEEGLLGQTYSSQKTHYITQIPENYVQISSGLGNSYARALLLIPLKHNNLAEGVIEIACFHELDDYQIEFAEKITENTASFIHSIQIQSKMQTLVNELQLRAEQFSAQELVMQQNFRDFQEKQAENEKMIRDLQTQLFQLKS